MAWEVERDNSLAQSEWKIDRRWYGLSPAIATATATATTTATTTTATTTLLHYYCYHSHRSVTTTTNNIGTSSNNSHSNSNLGQNRKELQRREANLAICIAQGIATTKVNVIAKLWVYFRERERQPARTVLP